MAEEQSDRYIKIARACLRAINDVSRDNSGRDESVRKVYEAIETAFAEEMADYEQRLDLAGSVLQRIASGELSTAQMQKLAQDTLRETLHWQSGGSGSNGSSLH